MKKKVYIETYGCQMNVADSELIATVLKNDNFELVKYPEESDVILINTCSIRHNAEQKIHKRLEGLQYIRRKNRDLKIGIIGCMAERIGDGLFEKEGFVNFLAGPDAYRNIASILEYSETERVTDIVLSHTEAYEDILPEKILDDGVSAFVPVMRGCENFCSYCVVPFTRGKERSRARQSIFDEIKNHLQKGVAEITLLGQNVNSYLIEERTETLDFPDLLQQLAVEFEATRFRFATSHPKDLSDKLLQVIASHHNICKSIHLPMQSGSNEVLKRMNRKYTVEWYLERIFTIKKIIPDCTISTDIITGFCSETEDDHLKTLTAMKEAGFFHAFMFKYSERPGTAAAKVLKDDVPDYVKTRRLTEIIDLQNKLSKLNNNYDQGKKFEVLVEGQSKRSKDELMGRTSQNKVVVFKANIAQYPAGSYVHAKITSVSSATLKGELC